MRDSFPFNEKATGYARGPIPEADFPRPGEDVTVGDKKGNLSAKQTGGVHSARNPGSCCSSTASALPRWLMASFSSGVSWA